MSEEQGVGGKIPILQPDAVGGGGKRPTSHLTIRALSETAETLTLQQYTDPLFRAHLKETDLDKHISFSTVIIQSLLLNYA